MVCHYGVMDALCGVQAPNAGLIETRMWIDDDGQSHLQPLGPLRRPLHRTCAEVEQMKLAG